MRRTMLERKIHLLKTAVYPIRPTQLCAIVNMGYNRFKPVIDKLAELDLVTLFPPDRKWYWVQTTPDGIEEVKRYETLMKRLGEEDHILEHPVYIYTHRVQQR